ncbi:hypothetical protein EJ04DRAFT_571612 [Polyplosphaeria fusca]|uniref:Uncharacterized protein n=1 Tax=Polyplosphaeria fusca TaxID=682080 RepID=A0A9P4V9D0_9PLEO|nr:hypothetical protein EJ04DRAFT_571612 [Polyplosphaeria fusca]
MLTTYRIVLVFLFMCVVEGGHFMPGWNMPVDDRHRTLRAAKRRSEFERRDDFLTLRKDVELVYAEERDLQDEDDQIFSSRLRLQANRPVLFLEDFDHLLSEVDCDESEMSITVVQVDVFDEARMACSTLIHGLVLSSHESCNTGHGAHSVFNVLAMDFDEETLRIVLHVQNSTIKQAFPSISFSFGLTSETHSVYQHDRLSKRNSPSRIIERSPAEPSAIVYTNDTSNTASLNFSQIDTTFKLPGNVSFPFDLGCRNCTGTGDLILSTTHFEFNELANIFNGTDDDLVKSGAIQMDLKGFQMSIGLRATPELEVSQDINIFKYTIIGVTIPGIGMVGFGFSLDLQFQAALNTSMEIGFGFDVVVPDSYIRLDVAELQNCAIEGFNPEITAQPLRSNISDIEMTLLAGLKQSFPFGLSILGFDLTFGPFLSAPNFNLEATQFLSTEVGADCEKNGTTDSKFKEEFTNLTHVQYNVGFAAGIQVPVIGDITIAPTDIPLATQCLVYQTEGAETGLMLATAALASITTPPEASASASDSPGKKGDAGGSRAMLPKWYSPVVVLTFCAIAVVLVVA